MPPSILRLAIEGLGRQLYPDLDLWTTAKPILEDWMRERSSPMAHVKRLIDDWPEISDDLMAMPGLLHAFVREREREQKQPKRRDMRPFQRQAKTMRQMFASAAALFAGILWLGFDLYPQAIGIVATALGAAGLVVGVLRR